MTRKIALALTAAVLALSACVPAPVHRLATRAIIADVPQPTMKVFAPQSAPATRHSNVDLARDFLDLSFELESGQPLPLLTRFEGPITVHVTGDVPATLATDLHNLLNRLRREAGLNITQTSSARANPNATITVAAVTRAEIRRALPQAACFVAPNVKTLSEYRSARRSAQTNWTLLKDRRQIAIFLPNDASPQEVRDCLHEEVAQALGPLNDLYRLPETVFNDDNVHTVLTRFDMLILRAYYDPQLRSGMTRRQVAAVLPSIFARINPQGATLQPSALSDTPQTWSRTIETALGRGGSNSQRRKAAKAAVSQARALGWRDHRTAFAHYAYGRVLQPTDPVASLAQYRIADRIYAQSPRTALHRSYVATRLAGFALKRGDAALALRRMEPNIALARRHKNAALLATLLLLKAEALSLQGRDAEAQPVRVDSIGWARYGFGPAWAVKAKLREIAALSPRR